MFNPNDHQSYYNLMSRVFRNSGISNHDFQDGLYLQLKTYFKQLDPDVELEYNFGEGYPAQFVIKVDEVTLLKFSFYTHTYSDNNYKKLLSRRKNNREHEQEILEADYKELKTFEGYKDKPISMLNKKNYRTNKVKRYQIRDLIMLNLRKTTVSTNLEEKVEELKKRVKKQEGNVKRIEEDIKDLQNKRELTDNKHAEWVTRFKAWGYENEEQ